MLDFALIFNQGVRGSNPRWVHQKHTGSTWTRSSLFFTLAGSKRTRVSGNYRKAGTEVMFAGGAKGIYTRTRKGSERKENTPVVCF